MDQRIRLAGGDMPEIRIAAFEVRAREMEKPAAARRHQAAESAGPHAGLRPGRKAGNEYQKQ
jgi:hypothetical protein